MIQKRSNPDLEWQDLADLRSNFYGVVEHRDTVRKGCKILNEYLDAGWDLIPKDITENEESLKLNSSVELKRDGSLVSDRLIEICEGQTITPEFLLKAHNLSPKEWKVVAYRNNYWHSQIRGGKRLLMYQSRVTVKPYAEDEISLQVIKEWFDNFEPKPFKYEVYTDNYGSGENCLLLPIVDLHYNLLVSEFITGNNYNCEIAKQKFNAVIQDVIYRCKDRNIEKIIFPIGNDLFNANGINGTTFKGTPQTNEKHIFEAYIELFDIMVSAIYELVKIAPVDVIYIPSNHDKEITFYFVYNLYTQFKNDPNISVDYSPLTNKYRRFGNTVMMFTHDGKIDKLGNTVFDEAKDLIAGAKYVEVFLGHLHTEIVRQDRNLTIRRLPTISGRSIYACENNYGSNTTCQSFILNNKKNITDILFTTIDT